MWPMGPNEQAIQAKMQQIEQYRNSGQAIDSDQMDDAGQEALKRLMHGGAMAPTPAAAPQSAPSTHPPSLLGGGNTPTQYQPAPGPGQPQQGSPGMPPQLGQPQGGPQPAMQPQGMPQPQAPPPQGAQVAPQQGGIWADAEAMQKRRAMSGLPGVQ